MRNTHGLKFMLLLGVPSFGLTFAVTILTAFLPTILHTFINPLLIGLIIGAEGFFGLFVPIIFGALADRSKTVGGRWKYLLPATAAMISALVIMGVLRHIVVIGLMVALFYFGYFAYLAPYWATYPDLIPKEYSGRSRSAESSWRAVGAFFALISGGFMLTVWKPLGFIVAAGLLALVTVIFGTAIKGHGGKRIHTNDKSMAKNAKYVLRIFRRERDMRNLLIANGFWNAALQSIQAFTVLFFTQGLHRSAHFVSGVIFPIAAIGILIMAPLAGRLADKWGHFRILAAASFIYGIGGLIPVFTQSYWVVIVIPLVSGAAATIMTLPYSALMRLIKEHPHGAISGLFGISRGVGTFLGPLITGVVIQYGRGIFPSTNGYAGEWLAAGGFVLISLLFMLQIRSREL